MQSDRETSPADDAPDPWDDPYADDPDSAPVVVLDKIPRVYALYRVEDEEEADAPVAAGVIGWALALPSGRTIVLRGIDEPGRLSIAVHGDLARAAAVSSRYRDADLVPVAERDALAG